MPLKSVIGVPGPSGSLGVNDDDGAAAIATIGTYRRVASGVAVASGAIVWGTQVGFAPPTYNGVGNYTITLLVLPGVAAFARVIPFGQEGSAFQNGPIVAGAITVLGQTVVGANVAAAPGQVGAAVAKDISFTIEVYDV